MYRAAWSLANGAPTAAARRVDGEGDGVRRRLASSGRQALQCHGAIGYTVEYDLHLYLKRTWALAAGVGRRPHAPRVYRSSANRELGVVEAMPEAYIVGRRAARPSGMRARAAGLIATHRTPPTSAPCTPLDTRSMERTGIDPGAVEDVVFGCVDTIGPQAGDIARTCWLAAGLPEEVPGVTVDRQCGSSQQAIHFAAQAVMSGTTDVVVAGGVQNMSMIPISLGHDRRAADGVREPVHRVRRVGGPLRRPGGVAVPQRPR